MLRLLFAFRQFFVTAAVQGKVGENLEQGEQDKYRDIMPCCENQKHAKQKGNVQNHYTAIGCSHQLVECYSLIFLANHKVPDK